MSISMNVDSNIRNWNLMLMQLTRSTIISSILSHTYDDIAIVLQNIESSYGPWNSPKKKSIFFFPEMSYYILEEKKKLNFKRITCNFTSHITHSHVQVLQINIWIYRIEFSYLQVIVYRKKTIENHESEYVLLL